MSRRSAAALALAALAPGCQGVQSALAPAGEEAARINTLSIVLFVFCTAIFLGVIAATAAAIYGGPRWRSLLRREGLVIWAGIVFPAVSLSALLIYGVVVMGKGAEAAAELGALRVTVTGERWWWRVEYQLPDGRRFESANEIRIPVGQPVRLDLTSADVIHSFWVPRLAGKLDMIPGRVNTLTLRATEPGLSRGQCAEYCGGPHALMSFFVVAMAPEDHARWLAAEASAAAAPNGAAAAEGKALFERSGCGGCHAVRGTAADGIIGPDLTHVGSRHSLAAATLPNDPEAFARWISQSDHVKPENLMPPYAIFTDAELRSLAIYLDGLR